MISFVFLKSCLFQALISSQMVGFEPELLRLKPTCVPTDSCPVHLIAVANLCTDAKSGSLKLNFFSSRSDAGHGQQGDRPQRPEASEHPPQPRRQEQEPAASGHHPQDR